MGEFGRPCERTPISRKITSRRCDPAGGMQIIQNLITSSRESRVKEGSNLGITGEPGDGGEPNCCNIPRAGFAVDPPSLASFGERLCDLQGILQYVRVLRSQRSLTKESVERFARPRPLHPHLSSNCREILESFVGQKTAAHGWSVKSSIRFKVASTEAT